MTVVKTATRWPLTPLKRVVALNPETLTDSTGDEFEFDYIDIGTIADGRIGNTERHNFGDAPSRARRVVRDGDVLVSTVRTYLRAIASVSTEHDGDIASTGFAVLRPDKSHLEPRYVRYWCLGEPFVSELVGRSVGVSYPAVNAREVVTLPIATPPLSTQRRIADHLDRETQRIDLLIRQNRAILDLLNERESSVIGSALGSSALCRSDGVPIGLADEQMIALRRAAKVQSGLALNSQDVPSDPVEVPYLRVANVQDGTVDLTELKTVSVERERLSRWLLRAGDVLMTEGGDPDKLGRGAVWDGRINPCIHQNHVFAVRPDPTILHPDYLALVTRHPYARLYFEVTASKTTGIASTSTAKIGDFRIPVKAVDEQVRLVRQVKAQLEQIYELSAKIQSMIDLLVERRRALITSAVIEDSGPKETVE